MNSLELPAGSAVTEAPGRKFWVYLVTLPDGSQFLWNSLTGQSEPQPQPAEDRL